MVPHILAPRVMGELPLDRQLLCDLSSFKFSS
jgi:hypothetical protein